MEKSFKLSGQGSLKFVRLSHVLREIPDEVLKYVYIPKCQFPEGLKVIGRRNFMRYDGDKGCKHVTFPSTLEYILRGAFWNNNIEEFVIPTNVKAIFPNAFGYCDKLKKVKFMSDETVVLPGAFYWCDHLDSLPICKAPPLGDRVFGADEVRYDGDTLTYIPSYYCGKLVVKDGTRQIASNINLEIYDGITEQYLPDSLKYNGKYLEFTKVLRSSEKKRIELNLLCTYKLCSFNCLLK